MGGLVEGEKERPVGYATLQRIGPDEQMWVLCRENCVVHVFPPTSLRNPDVNQDHDG